MFGLIEKHFGKRSNLTYSVGHPSNDTMQIWGKTVILIITKAKSVRSPNITIAKYSANDFTFSSSSDF